jgi:hypothetical protein
MTSKDVAADSDPGAETALEPPASDETEMLQEKSGVGPLAGPGPTGWIAAALVAVGQEVAPALRLAP